MNRAHVRTRQLKNNSLGTNIIAYCYLFGQENDTPVAYNTYACSEKHYASRVQEIRQRTHDKPLRFIRNTGQKFSYEKSSGPYDLLAPLAKLRPLHNIAIQDRLSFIGSHKPQNITVCITRRQGKQRAVDGRRSHRVPGITSRIVALKRGR